MKILKAYEMIDIPHEIAVCPYCGDKLTAQCSEWSQCEDMSWKAENIELECLSEPDIEDSEKWHVWIDSHTMMPYVYWLPVEEKVLAWINAHYRWEL